MAIALSGTAAERARLGQLLLARVGEQGSASHAYAMSPELTSGPEGARNIADLKGGPTTIQILNQPLHLIATFRRASFDQFLTVRIHGNFATPDARRLIVSIGRGCKNNWRSH